MRREPDEMLLDLLVTELHYFLLQKGLDTETRPGTQLLI